MPRVYSPDLSEHFILIHNKRRMGIIEFREKKTRALVAYYSYDEDRDLKIGHREDIAVKALPKGPGFVRSNRVFYLADFEKPPCFR